MKQDEGDSARTSPAPQDEWDVAEALIAAEAPALDTVAQPPSGGGVASSLPLFAANMLEAVLPLVRNIALAHLIAPTEFGVAISLSIVIGMIEIIADFGLPIYAVRHALPTDEATALGTLQTVAVLRSAVLGGVLGLSAPLMAAAFQAPRATTAYAMLGLICFLRGFENLAVKAAMRHYVFWREGLVIAASQLFGLLATLAIAAATHDFACTMWGLLASTVVTVVLSHALSPAAFRFRWNSQVARDAASFGRPLVVNGIAVAASLSDRVVVGAALGAPELATYNVAFGTAMLPRTVLVKFLTSAVLPRFVEYRDKGKDPRVLINSWTVCLSALAFAYGLTLDLFGEQVLRCVFGPAYAPSRLVMSLFAMSLSIKFMMLLPNPIAYAAGRTKLITLGSILAAVALLPGIGVLVLARSLPGFVLAMGIAECFMLVILLRASLQRLDLSAFIVWPSGAAPYVLLSPLAVLSVLRPDVSFELWVLACACVATLGATFYAVMARRFHIEPGALFRARKATASNERSVPDGSDPVLDYGRA